MKMRLIKVILEEITQYILYASTDGTTTLDFIFKLSSYSQVKRFLPQSSGIGKWDQDPCNGLVIVLGKCEVCTHFRKVTTFPLWLESIGYNILEEEDVISSAIDHSF